MRYGARYEEKKNQIKRARTNKHEENKHKRAGARECRINNDK